MQIPPDWSRPRRQIARVYFEEMQTIKDYESMVRVIANRLDYKIDERGNSSFVRQVINDIRRLASHS